MDGRASEDGRKCHSVMAIATVAATADAAINPDRGIEIAGLTGGVGRSAESVGGFSRAGTGTAACGAMASSTSPTNR